MNTEKLAFNSNLGRYAKKKLPQGWIKPVAGLRNFIAHHSRVWNRNFPQMPQLPTRLNQPWTEVSDIPASKLYAQLCCLSYLQNSIHPDNDFGNKLKAIIASHPNVDLRAMGFPKNWGNQPLRENN